MVASLTIANIHWYDTGQLRHDPATTGLRMIVSTSLAGLGMIARTHFFVPTAEL